MKPIQIHPVSAVAGASLVAVLVLLTSMQQVAAQRIQLLSAEEKEILGHMSIVHLDDGQGGTNKTIRIGGVNVQVVNDLGATSTTNGLGNLIVGYNELRNDPSDDRTGSHNAVVGQWQTYTRFGGQVVGLNNSVTGAYASVSGGYKNWASGDYASVTGGSTNAAGGTYASVDGGIYNAASGAYAAVGGGYLITAGGSYDWAGGSCYWCDQ